MPALATIKLPMIFEVDVIQYERSKVAELSIPDLAMYLKTLVSRYFDTMFVETYRVAMRCEIAFYYLLVQTWMKVLIEVTLVVKKKDVLKRLVCIPEPTRLDA